MKVGILNFHRALNYGAVLQCYGLQEVLKEMGHEVVVLDYRPYCIEKTRFFFNTNYIKQGRFFLFLKSFIASILSLPNNIKAHRSFNRFLKEHINLSNDIITFKNLNLLDDYDIIFVGSDQVWSERITQLDPVYLGDFPRKKVKYVSYAASLGSSSYFNDPKQKQLIHYLKNYSNISVREDYLKDWLNEHNIDSKVTLDPSLLADATIYNYIANTTIKKDYVLLIDLHGINSAYNFAQKISSQLDCELYTLKASGWSRRSNDIIGVSPSMYLGLIKNAKCIITSSFHATAFSISFRKDFYALQCDADGRYRTLLNSLDLGSRLIDSSSNMKFNSIDYSGIEKRQQYLKDSSMSYISGCF